MKLSFINFNMKMTPSKLMYLCNKLANITGSSRYLATIQSSENTRTVHHSAPLNISYVGVLRFAALLHSVLLELLNCGSSL